MIAKVARAAHERDALMTYVRALCLALALGLGLSAAPSPAMAVQPDEVLHDPVLEARARKISAGLRCLVCQNQSIDESDAPLARDLRILVRERLMAGDSDEEVVAFVVERYGEYARLSPRLSRQTLFLWIAPGLFLLFGGILALMLFRRNSARHTPAAPLSAEEEARIAALLKDND